MAEVEQPIIIKKINKVEGGHHGGAWKVAYADFVTAMMAFFLLLWLISSASESQLEGIAEYFTPTIGLKDSAGIGFQGGTAPTDIGTKKDELTPPGVVIGSQPQGPIPEDPKKEALIESTEDSNLFEKAQKEIKKAFETDPNLQEIRDKIIVEQTPEGLKIELLDSDKKSMFQPGSANLTPHGERILKRMLGVVTRMPNHISITGHTDSTPFPKGSKLSNWDLSTLRANAARRFMVEQGMEGERTQKITGRADRELLVPAEPKSPRNRRITIILLRGSHMIIPISSQPATRELLSVPKVNRRVDKEKKAKEVSESAEQEETDQILPSYPSKPEKVDPQYRDQLPGDALGKNMPGVSGGGNTGSSAVSREQRLRAMENDAQSAGSDKASEAANTPDSAGTE